MLPAASEMISCKIICLCFVLWKTFLGSEMPKLMASLHGLTSTNATLLCLCFKLTSQHDLLAQAELLPVCLWDTRCILGVR